MRKRIAREWAWISMLIAVLTLTLTLAMFGCSSESVIERNRSAQHVQDQVMADYQFEIIYLNWRGVYLLKFEGHEYLTRGISSHILHTVSCPGFHEAE